MARVARRDIVTKFVDHDIITNIGGTIIFTDLAANFFASAVLVGDILTFENVPGDLQQGGTVVSTANLGNYEIVNVLSSTQLELAMNTTVEIGTFEYTVYRVTSEKIGPDQFANWINLSGEVAPLLRDPDFADLGYEGSGETSFFPGSISPLLQYGIIVGDVEEDFDGLLRPPDGVTLGAYESRGTYTHQGIQRILELIGGLSSQPACKFLIGAEGELDAQYNRPEAPIQWNLGLGDKIAEVPFTGSWVISQAASGGLLVLQSEFIWRWLLTSNQAARCDFSELHDGVLDEFTELAVATEDNVMLFRSTFPRIYWDPLSIATPVITINIRFEGKFVNQAFQGGVGYRCPNSAEFVLRDWRQLKVTP